MSSPHAATRVAASVASISLACALLTGCSDSNGSITMVQRSTTTGVERSAPGGSDASSSAVKWGSCSGVDIAVSADTMSSARADGMQCATLDVPVDHAKPKGATTELAIARIPATGRAAQRIGSLIVNPGGPGGSGLEFLASSAIAFPAAVRQRFDIVSFDPRGVAASTPLDCLTEAQRAEYVDQETPDDPATAIAQSLDQEQAVASGCADDDEALFHHMGTDQVAGDVDSLRVAVGDDKLTFLGLSYGTRIAASYAAQFPDKVRALVLDGSVTPSRDLAESSGGQVKGISRALNRVIDACNADASCPIAPDAGARLDAAAASLDASPMTVTTGTGDETLDKDKFVTGVVTALYDPSLSAPLAEAVAALDGSDQARRNDGARFILDLAGEQDSKRPDGTYGNGYETQAVVNCLDADSPLDSAEVPRVREIAGPIPKLLDNDPAADAPSCTKLPTGDGLTITGNGAKDRILVVGTEGDPATPIEWTKQMVDALGGVANITYGGSGHTASLNRKCVTDQVSEFLISGTIPTDLENCPRDPSESDIYAQIANQFEAIGLTAAQGTCIANALRTEIDPLGVVAMNRDDADPALIATVQRAAQSCR